jgi:ABC-type branched-subunit amino acid transport system substrate-binding protein
MKILLALTLLLTWQQPTANVPIKIGILFPSEGALRKAGEDSCVALSAYFEELNSQGGINGRRLELQTVLVDKEWETTAINLKRLSREQKVLAFVGGIAAGRDEEIETLMQTEAVPLIGPATLNPGDLDRYVFHLLPGVKEQARALVNFAASQPDLKKSPAVILSLSGSLNNESADAAEAQSKKLGWLGVNKVVATKSTLKPLELVNDMKRRGVQTVFVFGDATAVKAIVDETVAQGLTPTFFAPGYTVKPELYNALTPALKNKFFISLPTVPADITAAEEYRALQSKYGLPSSSVLSQFLTLAAAKVMIEGLKQGGGIPEDSTKPFDVNAARERLVVGLEKLRDFNTGLGRPVTFGKDRRIGSYGAHILGIDPVTNQLAPRQFVSAN